MKPFDPRLLRVARSVWWMLSFGAFWALLQTTGIVLFALSATGIVVALFDGHPLDWPVLLGGLLAGTGLRALAAWGSASTAARGAATAKAQLRARGMAAIERGGAELLIGSSRADTTLVLGRGLDALDDYFSSYLPQLLLAVIATPLLWLVVLSQDLQSAVTIAIVLPLIPMFMVLIGLATRGVQAQQWTALSALGRQFLDLVDGLSTLKIFRRERAQSVGIEASGQEYRRRTMKVLRLSFLSGFVLELAATLSVALVAVLIGTRLVAGQLDLAVGLFVLLLVPDVFAPIRQVGASFHAAADGLGSADELFTLIEQSDALVAARRLVRGNVIMTAPRALGIEVDRSQGVVLSGFSVWRGEHRVVDSLSARFAAGAVTAITGPSGVGKSSLLAGMLGFARSDGQFTIQGVPFAEQAARSRIAWVPQRPSLIAGSIADNVALGDPEPDAALIADALAQAVATELEPERALGAGGGGLSGGQAQRVSVARAFYRVARHPEVQTLLLDEPSSALDGDTQQRLAEQLRALADAGTTVIVVSHRDGLVANADAIVELGVTA